MNCEPSRSLIGRTAVYNRVGYDQRTIEFAENGTFGAGDDRMERCWGIRLQNNIPVLQILGEDGLTASLTRDTADANVWRGHWVIHEKMPVTITLESA
jgi:hypothetical protein